MGHGALPGEALSGTGTGNQKEEASASLTGGIRLDTEKTAGFRIPRYFKVAIRGFEKVGLHKEAERVRKRLNKVKEGMMEG